MKKVSIIIPIFNGEKYLDQTIDSCLNQIWENIEIFLIDDCSRDNSREIIKKYVTEDKRIKAVFNNKNLGLLKNVNQALKLISGEMIMLLGQDDILLPNHIKIMSEKLLDEVSFVYCNSDIIDSNGDIVKRNNSQDCKNVNLFDLAKWNYINSCGLLMSAEKFIKVGGFTESEKFPNYGEWDLWIKLSKVGTIEFETRISSLYRKHATNISKTFTDPSTKIKLEEYYRSCRRKAFEIGEFTKLEKIILYLHYMKYYIIRKID